MNQITTIAQPPAPGIIPTTMREAMDLATMMATAKLVPKDLQKSPADCLLVIQQAVRWQMDPFAVAQECSVIQGKIMYSGKLVAAVVNTLGNLAERLSFAYDGQGNARVITVSGRLQGEQLPRTVAVKLADARTNNRVWQTQPDQQLMYHGTRVWARRHMPELMLGVWSPEEFDEKPGNNTPQPEPRQNPHVTRPEDVQEAETPVEYNKDGPVDNIPFSDPDIKPLPRKKDYRPSFEGLQKEMYAFVNPVSLLKWGSEVRNEVGKFHTDDQAIMRDRFKAHLESLRRKTQPDHDPETGEVRDMVPDPIDPPYSPQYVKNADERT